MNYSALPVTAGVESDPLSGASIHCILFQRLAASSKSRDPFLGVRRSGPLGSAGKSSRLALVVDDISRRIQLRLLHDSEFSGLGRRVRHYVPSLRMCKLRGSPPQRG